MARDAFLHRLPIDPALSVWTLAAVADARWRSLIDATAISCSSLGRRTVTRGTATGSIE